MCVIMLHMKIATIREVQHHLSKVLAWVEKGEEVQVTRRNKVVARLVPAGTAGAAAVSLPDFAGRARSIWGAQPKGGSLSRTILAEREERL
jgi:prevent-host-death family protein